MAFWFKKKHSEPKFRLRAEDMRPLYTPPAGEGAGCIASDRITVDGAPVGYLYREAPDGAFPDSGWRLLSGDESQDYVDDPAHLRVYDLNTLCNYDERILPLLGAPVGTAFVWSEDGWIEERLDG